MHLVVLAALLAGSVGAAPAADTSVWRYAPLKPIAGVDGFGLVSTSGRDNIWVAGSQPTVLERFDGRRWRAAPQPPGSIRALSTASPGHVWVLTEGPPYRWDTKVWRSMRPGPAELLAAVPGGGAWLVERGKLIRYDGRRWHTVPTPARFEIGAIVARSAKDVWVVGRHKSGKPVYDDIEGGLPAAYRWNGRALAAVPVTAPKSSRSILRLDDVVVGKGGELWLAGRSVLDGDRLPVIHRRGGTWATSAPPRTPAPQEIEPDGAGGVWFDYGLDQPLWRSRAGKWTKVAAPKPPPGRAFGMFTHPGGGVTAHIPGTTLLVRAGATFVPPPGKTYSPETAGPAQKSADRMVMTGPHRK